MRLLLDVHIFTFFNCRLAKMDDDAYRTATMTTMAPAPASQDPLQAAIIRLVELSWESPSMCTTPTASMASYAQREYPWRSCNSGCYDDHYASFEITIYTVATLIARGF